MDIQSNGLNKAERLNSKNTIDELFSGNNKSFSAYPLRVVYMPVEKKEYALASILISVPKKRFKRAVKRNKVKRQIREGYRKNKHELLNVLKEKEFGLAIAFIYLSNEIQPTEAIEETIKKILNKIIEKIQ
jgi:ribonuclease P protein component, eubacterial